MVYITKNLSYLEVKEARDKYPTSKFEKFMFKYFSIDTRPRDMWMQRIFIYVEFILSSTGLLLVVLEKNPKIPGIIFSLLLVMLIIPYTVAWFMRRSKVKKIARYLGISFKEYNQYCL